MRNSYDGEIGRGRRTGNDSSSSRESSPGRSAPKRPFSPAGSDAGETSMSVDPAPATHSPPQERPLIRQAVAFASDKQPQNIVTYEATPPTVTVRFLPGQEVPVPAKKKAKRTKKGDMFSSQTSKFRIDTYDPTPSTQPPIAHGNGPYSSMYRGTPAPPKPPRKVSPATTASSSTYARNSSTASSNPPSSCVPPYALPAAAPQPPPPAQPATRSPPPPKKRAEPPSHFAEMEGPPPHQNHYYSSYPPAPGSNSSAYTPSPYYRHDYERGTWGHDRNSRSPRQKSRNRRSMDHSQDSDSSSRYQNRDSGRSNAQSSSSASQRSKYPLRMLTLLIQDVRSGTTDHQLAEVKVPLRPADEPVGTSYWADAQDITKQLQRGPSRIDGPAKVYTPRGKYRHFILRVSKNNDDEFISANVSVPAERTVDLVVEMLSPPGAPPPPPKIPSGLFDSPPHDDYEQELSSDQLDAVVKRKPRQLQDARKRANSPSFDDYDGPESPPPHKISRYKYPSESARRHPQRHPSPDSTMSSGPPPRGRRSTSKERRYYDPMPATPPIPSSPQPHEADFMRALKEKVREYDGKGFADFFRSNAGNSVSDTLSQYVFLTKLFDKFIGDKIEEFSHPIEEKHIVKLMKIHDASFVDDCKETMRLMSLYGDPTFPRYDPKVTEMIELKSQQSKEAARKEFLHLLYRNDNIWNNRSPGGPRPPAKSSQTSSSDSSLSSRGDPAPSRATKAMFVD